MKISYLIFLLFLSLSSTYSAEKSSPYFPSISSYWDWGKSITRTLTYPLTWSPSTSNLKTPPPVPPRQGIVQDPTERELNHFIQKLHESYMTLQVDDFTSEMFYKVIDFSTYDRVRDPQAFEDWRVQLIRVTKNKYIFNYPATQKSELSYLLTDIGFYHNSSTIFNNLSTTDRGRLTQICFQAAANLPHIEVLIPEFAAINIHRIDIHDAVALRGYLNRLGEYQFYLAQKLSLCEDLQERAHWIQILKTMIVHDDPVQEDMGELMNKLGALHYINQVDLDFAAFQCKRLFALLPPPSPIDNEDKTCNYDRHVMSDIAKSLQDVLKKLHLKGEAAQFKIAQIVEIIERQVRQNNQASLSKTEIQKFIATLGSYN